MSESNFHTRLAMALAADPREQREIAKEIGSSPQQVSRWKREVSPSPDIIAKFVQVLGIDGHWLLRTWSDQYKMPGRTFSIAVNEYLVAC